MSADLESSKTFGELMLDLALRAGLEEYESAGTGAPILPTDKSDLALLRKWTNDGYKRFLRSDPDWTFCIEPITLTLSPDGKGAYNIDSDPGRYLLPFPIRSRPRGNWRFKDTSTPASQVLDYSARRVLLERQAHQGMSGIPEKAGCRRRPSGEGVNQSRIEWEVIFFPNPSGPFVLENDFRIPPYDLVEFDEHHVAGADHDHAIVMSAWDLWQAEDADDAEEAKRAHDEWMEAFAQSKALDARNRTRKHGRLVDPSISRVSRSRRAEGLVSSVGGVMLPAGDA